MADILTTIGDMLGLNKGKGTENAADQNKVLLSQLQDKIGGLINTGADKTNGYLTQANSLADLGPGAAGIYGDALGLNGAAGNAKATADFQAGPGYQFQLNQGLDALDRRAAAHGQLDSGSTNTDTVNYAQGQANQGWQSWLANLNTGINRNIGTLGDLATANSAQTGQRINLAGDIGSGQMAANNQYGAGQEASQGSLFDLLDNVAGVAGSVAGLNPFGKSGAPAGGGSMPAGGGGGFGGYGRF